MGFGENGKDLGENGMSEIFQYESSESSVEISGVKYGRWGVDDWMG